MPGEGPLPGCTLLIVSSHGRRGKEALSGLFYKGTNSIHEGSAFMNHIPKAPPPNTITLGIKFSSSEFGGDGNIQTIALSKEGLVFSVTVRYRFCLRGDS